MKVLNSSIVLALFAAGCACDHPADVLAPGTASAKAKQEVADQRVGAGAPLLDQKLPGPPPVGKDPQYQTDGPTVAQSGSEGGANSILPPALVVPKKGVDPLRTGGLKTTAVRNKMSPAMKRRRPGQPESGSWMGNNEKDGKGAATTKAARTANMTGVS